MPRLLELARALSGVAPAQIPADVRQLARLQHLAAAGASRAHGLTVPSSPASPSSVEATIAAQCAPGNYGFDDFLLGGATSLPLVPTLWAGVGDVALDDLLAATVIGNEAGARVGLLSFGAGKVGARDPHAAAAGAAAGLAWLRKDDPETMAAAIAEALLAPESPTAAWRLRAPKGGDLEILDDGSPLLRGPASITLPPVGERFLTRSLVLKRLPLADPLLVAAEAVEEILRRHVKASDKWLRADQVERVEIRVALPAFRALGGDSTLNAEHVSRSLALAVGVLVARHALGPATLSAAALAEREADIRLVAGKVVVHHDWSLTLRGAGVARTLGLSGESERRRLGPLAALPRPEAGDLTRLLRARPIQRLQELLGPTSADDGYSWCNPVDVKLYTTRGGWWPERREVPRGSAIAGDREAVARARFTEAEGEGGQAARGARAERLMGAPGSSPAAAWCAELCA